MNRMPEAKEKRGVPARCIALLFALLATASLTWAAPAAQPRYATPEAAVGALVEAVKANDQAELKAILGPLGDKLVSSGDAVADERGRAAFIKAYEAAHSLTFEGKAKAMLAIGPDAWPFPIPLVKAGHAWKFDTAKGEQEILDRRVGRNELSAIQVCLAIVDAEHEYAASHLGADGVPRYAAHIDSTPGKQDGLYWPAGPDETPSPLGPLVAAAAGQGYALDGNKVLAPYHGYFYRILSAQGKDAPGGAYSYLIKGKMIGGFAVIAYPARYGASGIKTFIVGYDGAVFEKDLGRNTARLAARIEAYNPDPTWKRAEHAPYEQAQ